MSSSLNIDSNNLFEQIWSYNELQAKPNPSQEDPSTNHQNINSNSSTASQATQIIYKPVYKVHVPKDSNPNLLKNLIVTLRSWVDFKDPHYSKSLIQLWKFFKKSKKINKHLLWLLYGNIQQEPQNFDKICQEIPILKQVSIFDYQKMQENVRVETLKQLKKADIQYILKYKRVKDIGEFKNYFYNFVRNLQDGQPYNKKSKI